MPFLCRKCTANVIMYRSAQTHRTTTMHTKIYWNWYLCGASCRIPVLEYQIVTKMKNEDRGEVDVSEEKDNIANSSSVNSSNIFDKIYATQRIYISWNFSFDEYVKQQREWQGQYRGKTRYLCHRSSFMVLLKTTTHTCAV